MNQLINSGGISEVGFAFFTALLTLVAMLIRMVSENRKETRNTREAVDNASQAALEAKESAEQTVANTRNVSNGFARNVLDELRKLNAGQEKLAASFTKHLEWHLEQEGKE